MFKSLAKNRAYKRLLDEKLFEYALQEFENGEMRDGLWAKALYQSSGDENKASALYLKLRVQSLKDEHLIVQEIERKIASKTKIIESEPELNHFQSLPPESNICFKCGKKTGINFGTPYQWLCRNCA